MQLNTLAPHTRNRKNPPVGRGGKRGKTSGRGGKGQTARAGHKIRPAIRDLIKKLPKRRGHGKNRSRSVRSERIVYAPVNLIALESAYENGAIISPATLFEKNLIRRVKGRLPRVKILGTGEVTKQFVLIGCEFSESARTALTKAGATFNA